MLVKICYYRCKEIWPIKMAFNYLATNTFLNNTVMDKDLHIFIPNAEMIEISIKQFIEMYSLRTKKSYEYWLLDIGHWTANLDDTFNFYERIKHDLRHLQLDLDDDLYFFEGKTILYVTILVVFQYLSCVGNETYVRVWEHYEINVSVQRKIAYMGSWNLDAGFQQMDAQKWIRRQDLEVRTFKSFLHYKIIFFFSKLHKSSKIGKNGNIKQLILFIC